MKKLFFIILAVALFLGALFSAFAENVQDPSNVEGYTIEHDSYFSVVSWCKNGDKNIYGKFYYPNGFDASEKYPIVIMCHGLGSRSEMVERAKWPQAVAEMGFVAYTFDFCGGGMNSLSDGSFMDMSIVTEISDLNAVMDYVKGQPFADTENLFLLGQSQGGVVSALTAASRPDEVKAMVLVYPAFCLVDDLHTFIPDLSKVTGDTVKTAMGTLGAVYALDAYDIDMMNEIGGFMGDVLIIHGLNDKTVPYSYSLAAIEGPYADANSELVLIAGQKSLHGFEMMYDEGREYALCAGTDFLVKHVK